MGFILPDKNQGIHVETRQQSFVIFTDFGNTRIELPYRNLNELIDLLGEAKKRAEDMSIPTDVLSKG